MCTCTHATHTVPDALRKVPVWLVHSYLGRSLCEHGCPVFLRSPVAKLKNASHQHAKQQAQFPKLFLVKPLEQASNMYCYVWLAAFSSTSFGHCQYSVISSAPITCCLASDVASALAAWDSPPNTHQAARSGPCLQVQLPHYSWTIWEQWPCFIYLCIPSNEHTA